MPISKTRPQSTTFSRCFKTGGTAGLGHEPRYYLMKTHYSDSFLWSQSRAAVAATQFVGLAGSIVLNHCGALPRRLFLKA